MEYVTILGVITVIFVVASTFIVPFLKNKGLWAVALFAVNIIEQVCDFMELQGMGYKKFSFVKKVLLMVNPKLTQDEIENIIETLVAEMNKLK